MPTRNLHRSTRWMATLVAALLLTCGSAVGTTVRDICRLKGARQNVLTATSLVIGLNGTGDGKSAAAVGALTETLQKFGMATVTMADVNPANVALVQVTAVIPEHGAHNGDRLDVRVASVNGAKSLQGGVLQQCWMLGPMAAPGMFALADGEIVLEDPDNPTVGIVRGGARMERDFVPTFIENGQITLLLDGSHATFAVASVIAKIINDAEAEPGTIIAMATGPGQVVVKVPTAELFDPADFIARINDLPVLMPAMKAQIRINRRTGTIAVTGNVEIDPVLFSQRGLTVDTRTPPVVPTEVDPLIERKPYQLITTQPEQAVRPDVERMLEAFNQLQVPMEDQIAVIWALKRTGRLHAEVIED